jgi:prepilin-type N-terminal cleavage/methylation domain-containing protein
MLDIVTIMKQLFNRDKGFTLVELIIVIAIIGILATISIVGFGRYQGDTRDARRSSSATVIVEALEKYYDVNGEYPSCAALSSVNIVTTLKGIGAGTLVAPQAASGSTNSIQCTSSGTLYSNGVDFFEYKGDGSSDCNGSGACLSYTLRYKDETDNIVKEITSRRTTLLATSGVISLSSNTLSFTSVNITWNAIQNAASYTLARAKDANFTTEYVTTNLTTPGTAVTGLSIGTPYFFRVQASNGTSQVTNWSSTLNVQTLSLNAPTISSVTGGHTSLTPTWNSVANAASYQLQYSTTNSFASTTTINNIIGTSQAIAGLLQGQNYYFKVTAVNGSYTSTASSVVNAITGVDTPTAPSVAQSTSGGITTYSWNAVSCPTNTTVSYQYRYSIDYSGGYISPWYSNGVTLTTYYSTNSEGYQYSIQVQAQCFNSSASAWSGSGSASYIRPVQPPSSIQYSISRAGANNTVYVYATSTCTNGAYFYARGDMHTWDLVWSDSGQLGWYADSHGGVWASPSFQYWGSKISVGTIRGTAGATMATGWRWNIAFDAYCSNYDTGRASATIGRHESPTMAVPADLNQEVFY